MTTESDVVDLSRIDSASAELTALIALHDSCCETDKAEKQRLMAEKIQTVLHLLDAMDSVGDNAVRSRVAYIKGRSLDCLEAFNPDAELHLSRSVKLNPSNTQAWNALGNCYWKCCNYTAATSCFRESLALNKSIETLNLLSAILRQTSSKPALSESLILCRESLAMDLRNHHSWYSLSLTLLNLYFTSTFQYQDLLRSLGGLKQTRTLLAQNSANDIDNEDVRCVLIQVYMYTQDYVAAAVEMFPDNDFINDDSPNNNNKSHDNNNSYSGYITSVSNYLSSLSSAISSRGHLKQKVIDMMVTDISSERARINQSSTAVTIHQNLASLLASTAEERDSDYCIHVKVIRHIGILNELPFTSFLCLEEGGRFCILTIYHYDYSSPVSMELTRSKAVLLAKPIIKQLRLRDVNQRLFDWERAGCQQEEVVMLHVHHPANIWVGGRPMDQSCFRPASLGLKAFDG